MAGKESKAPNALPRLENFIFTGKLGEGRYASVYKAYRKGNRREVVAIKCIRRTSLNKRATENLMTEIELLKRLKHRHIVELHDFEWDSEAIYLIMEYCSGGDLSEFIRSRRALPERVARKFLQQLAMALKFLRDRNISHMDLKPQNLLLSSSHDPVIKIGDFGFAQYLKSAKDSTDMRGSPLYMAPEMFLSDQYTCVVDLWSVGVILYEALYGQAPFASSTWRELEEKISDDKPIELPDFPHVSSNCRDLLTGLLRRDPKERITFTQFFDHSFIDLEHVPAPDSLTKACSLVTKAVEKDTEGNYQYAAQLYCAALDYFLPAIQFESDEERKQTLRSKIKEYIDRVEQLKVVIRKATRDPQTPSAALEAVIQRHKELKAAVHKVKDAEKADDRGQLELSLQLYQEALEGAISTLPTLKQEEQEPLRAEVERWLKRAEEIKLYLEIQPSKQESDFESEKSFSVKAKECVIQ